MEQTWAMKTIEKRKLERTEIKMLRWTLGVLLSEHLINEEGRRARAEWSV